MECNNTMFLCFSLHVQAVHKAEEEKKAILTELGQVCVKLASYPTRS